MTATQIHSTLFRCTTKSTTRCRLCAVSFSPMACLLAAAAAETRKNATKNKITEIRVSAVRTFPVHFYYFNFLCLHTRRAKKRDGKQMCRLKISFAFAILLSSELMTISFCASTFCFRLNLSSSQTKWLIAFALDA